MFFIYLKHQLYFLTENTFFLIPKSIKYRIF